MYSVNQTIYGLLNPVAFRLLLLTAGIVFSWLKWLRTGLTLSGLLLM